MRLRFHPAAIKGIKWYEYLIRFATGGLVTLAAGLIAEKCGPVIGGLFLGFPSIFPATVTLVEANKERKEEKAGKRAGPGKRIARRAAGATAAGTSLGSAGLVCFAVVIWLGGRQLAPWLALSVATLVWFAVNAAVWLAACRVMPRDPE